MLHSFALKRLSISLSPHLSSCPFLLVSSVRFTHKRWIVPVVYLLKYCKWSTILSYSLEYFHFCVFFLWQSDRCKSSIPSFFIALLLYPPCPKKRICFFSCQILYYVYGQVAKIVCLQFGAGQVAFSLKESVFCSQEWGWWELSLWAGKPKQWAKRCLKAQWRCTVGWQFSVVSSVRVTPFTLHIVMWSTVKL